MIYKLTGLVFAFSKVALLTSAMSVSVPTNAEAACGDSAGPGVNWENCRKKSLIVSGTDFTEAKFNKTDLSSSDLRDTTLNQASFDKANLVRASLKGSSALNANFTGVTASRTDFSEMNLTGTNFEKSEIIRSNFTKSIIENVDMSKSDLFRADFSNTNLSTVDFSFSSLARADFRGATFTGVTSVKNAFLYRTHFEGVDISVFTDLNQWQIDLACGDDDTKLPQGVERPTSWPCIAAED